jgi:mannose-1-phosphate guanylyltransferase
MPLSRRITGRSIPKQFCPVVGESSLLDQVRRRVALAVSPRHTILVLTRQHQDFYLDQVRDVPQSHLLVQPDNRGTAPAILYALMRLAKLDPYAVVTLFPSDHYVDDERLFMSQTKAAMRAASLSPTQLVLLGIRPDRAEAGFGWIEPAERRDCNAGPLRVARFWEKPSVPVANRLWKQGCLWNSFVIAGTIRAFLTMIVRALPELQRAFACAFSVLGTPHERAVMERIYAKIPCRDFSREVLERNAQDLMVLPVEDVYWNDLGDPRRVYETLARAQIRPGWMMRRTSAHRNDFVRRVLPRIESVRRGAKKGPR